MAQAQTVTPQQRMANFQAATRQTWQMIGSQSVSGELTTVAFNIPKNRLLSKLIIEVNATATLKSSAASIALDPYSPYNVLRRVTLDFNNGFQPVVLSGRDAFLYNSLRLNPQTLQPQNNIKGSTYVQNTASSAGVQNTIKFQLPVQVTLNDRDPQGLFMLQNDQTNVVLTLDIATLSAAYALNASNGDTVTFVNMTINLFAETFTIPADPAAQPDISVIKLTDSKGETFSGGGQSIVPLRTGTMYRKLFFLFLDSNGNPLQDSDFTGNIDLLFNGADNPYSVKPSILSGINQRELGYTLLPGCYALDLSYQGIPNYGNSRDIIDTEKITEFDLRFNTAKAGTVTIISEKLARLQSN